MTFDADEYVENTIRLGPEVAYCKTPARLDRLIKQLQEGIEHCKEELQEIDPGSSTGHQYLLAKYRLELVLEGCYD